MAGDTLVVAKLDRLARSVPDARAIADELKAKGVKLQLGSSVHDPMCKMFFNILATFTEFESDLIRMRTKEGMAVARAKGKLCGKSRSLPKCGQENCDGCKTEASIRCQILRQCSACTQPTVYRTLKRTKSANGGRGHDLRRLHERPHGRAGLCSRNDRESRTGWGGCPF